jgi:hypothetical protein
VPFQYANWKREWEGGGDGEGAGEGDKSDDGAQISEGLKGSSV